VCTHMHMHPSSYVMQYRHVLYSRMLLCSILTLAVADAEYSVKQRQTVSTTSPIIKFSLLLMYMYVCMLMFRYGFEHQHTLYLQPYFFLTMQLDRLITACTKIKQKGAKSNNRVPIQQKSSTQQTWGIS
jgi:hypothetical protein